MFRKSDMDSEFARTMTATVQQQLVPFHKSEMDSRLLLRFNRDTRLI